MRIKDCLAGRGKRLSKAVINNRGMTTKVIFFGRLAELTGQKELVLAGAGDTSGLLQELNARYPQLQGSSFVLAVGTTLVQSNTPLYEGAVVSLLPPYSGG